MKYRRLVLGVAFATLAAIGAARGSTTDSASRSPAPASAAESASSRAADARAKAYSRGRYALGFLGETWSWTVLALMLATGFSGRLRDAARRVWAGPNGCVFIYAALFFLVTALAGLPLDLYEGFFREKRYGFANQTLPEWIADQAKALGLEIVFGGLLLVLLYAAIRRYSRRWWIGATAISVAFLIIAVAVAPVFIAPMFNRFTPLPDSPLKSEILDLARSQGIGARDVFAVDASRQSSHTNAYVDGLLGTERIVLYDTLLKTDTNREILATLGHEMGHYVLHHVAIGIAFGAGGIALAFFLTEILFGRFARRHAARFGFRDIADVAGLPLLLLILSVLSFAGAPIGNSISRAEEHAADAFSLSVVRDPDAMISVFQKFHTHDLSEYDPPALVEFWFFTHPSLARRIRFCEEWKRAHPGTRP